MKIIDIPYICIIYYIYMIVYIIHISYATLSQAAVFEVPLQCKNGILRKHFQGPMIAKFAIVEIDLGKKTSATRPNLPGFFKWDACFTDHTMQINRNYLC